MSFRRGWLAALACISAVALNSVYVKADCNIGSAKNSRWKLESRDEVWWLATPCGDRFFSVGINGIDPDELKPVSFQNHVPGEWAPLHPADQSWVSSTVALIRGWGFNTAGGFSTPNLPLPNVPELDLGWRADLLWSDPFDPSIGRRLVATARTAVSSFKSSPYRIGYFSDNEIGWWNGALFSYYLRKPSTNYAKQKLMALIRSYYADHWRSFVNDFVVRPDLSSFDDLSRSAGVTAQLRPGGRGIGLIRAWTSIVTANYYRLVYEALHEADPGALIFGDRLPNYYDPDAIRAEAPYVDAIATNYNVDTPDGWIAHYFFDGLRRLTGNKPVLISEWYYAAQENRSGNSNNGPLMTVSTQAERAANAASAARGFALVPSVVGIHWFQYFDEPTGGRFDGEDYNFGLLDNGSRPYQTLADALTTANRSLAEIHQTQVLPISFGQPITIPEATIDAHEHTLGAWPKDQALVRGLSASSNEVPFGDMFLAWSSAGLHFATISMDYYDRDLLAYGATFPLSEAFRIDLGVDAGAGPHRFALFVIPSGAPTEKKVCPMKIEVCRIDNQTCEAFPVVATYFGSNPRITAQMTLPWTVLGVSRPPPEGHLRVQIAATAFYNSRWMSLTGARPREAIEDQASWQPAILTGGGAPENQLRVQAAPRSFAANIR